VLYINDNIELFNLEVGMSLVSLQRKEYALRYRRKTDQSLCVAAYMLLRDGLRKEYGITELPEFVFGYHGKPQIKGRPDIHFNLSHCDKAAACMISDRPVGIDVEIIKPYEPELVEATMNETEIHNILDSTDHSIAFAKLWTMKESLLKLTGEGISDNLHNLLNDTSDYIFTTRVFVEKSFVLTVCETKK